MLPLPSLSAGWCWLIKVGTIWEGTTNVLSLDLLRVLQKIGQEVRPSLPPSALTLLSLFDLPRSPLSPSLPPSLPPSLSLLPPLPSLPPLLLLVHPSLSPLPLSSPPPSSEKIFGVVTDAVKSRLSILPLARCQLETEADLIHERMQDIVTFVLRAVGEEPECLEVAARDLALSLAHVYISKTASYIGNHQQVYEGENLFSGKLSFTIPNFSL